MKKVSPFLVDRAHHGRAVPGCVDANTNHSLRAGGLAQAIDPGGDGGRVGVAEGRVTGAKLAADDGVRLRAAGQDRVVARATVIARIVAGQRALVLAKDGLDRAVDVEMNHRPTFGAHWRESVRCHHLLERSERRPVEAAQVAIDRVEAGHDAAGQVHEQRVRRQRLDAEHAVLAHDRSVDQESQLRFHRVHDQRARFQAPELVAQSLVDAKVARKRSEAGETAVTGKRGVRAADLDVPRVGATAFGSSDDNHLRACHRGESRRTFWVLGVGVCVCIDNNHQHSRRAFFQATSAILAQPLSSPRRPSARNPR